MIQAWDVDPRKPRPNPLVGAVMHRGARITAGGQCGIMATLAWLFCPWSAIVDAFLLPVLVYVRAPLKRSAAMKIGTVVIAVLFKPTSVSGR
jgi:hypothetical protein